MAALHEIFGRQKAKMILRDIEYINGEFRAVGFIYGHPHVTDGHEAVSSAVHSVDFKLHRLVTANTDYELISENPYEVHR